MYFTFFGPEISVEYFVQEFFRHFPLDENCYSTKFFSIAGQVYASIVTQYMQTSHAHIYDLLSVFTTFLFEASK